MHKLLPLVVAGCAVTLLFDATAATASRRFALPYIWASVGSFAIYLVLGALAANRAGLAAAPALGGLIGAVDATVGEAISSAIGPLRTPLESDALWYRLLIAAEVVVIAIVVTYIGGYAAMRWLRRS